jgi:hypothetical protein
MQAIRTRYLAPTNHRGARIVARAAAGRRVYAWDYSLSPEDNHKVAACEFCADIWDEYPVQPFAGGTLHDGSWVHVLKWNK